MAANTVTNLINLDFNTLKEGLKTYAREQAFFKDYDFNGSNISALLNILSYNTHQNAFYLNMLFSEMFLDSAQLRTSVASHTKDLNYLPRSFRSAKATVDITIDTGGNTAIVTVPKNQPFSTRIANRNYQFVTDQATTLTSSNNGVFVASNVSIFEGNYIVDTFYVAGTDPLLYTLSDPTIDTTSLTVVVSDDNGAENYTLATSFLGVTETSTVFFMQMGDLNRYTIYFGNGIIGKKPKNGATVFAEYRVCSGELPNGAFEFTNDRNIQGFGNVTIIPVKDSSGLPIRASGGAIYESLSDIKFNAPRHYQTQERAVTANDFQILLQQQFPEIAAITVFGGEEATPPQYGKVFIVVDLHGFDGIPDHKKEQFRLWLSTRMPLTTIPVFVDPTFTYAKMDVDVTYNLNKYDVTTGDVPSLVLAAILQFAEDHLNTFKVTMRFSKLLAAIDGAHTSILSSASTFFPYKTIAPVINESFSTVLDFFMPLKDDLPKLETIHGINKERTVFSSVFSFGGKPCQLEDDNNGLLRIAYSTKNDFVSIIDNIGTVDYKTGRIVINNLVVSSYIGDVIKVYVTPKTNDVAFGRTDFFTIKSEDISITTKGVRE
jgi:hypothetical protein